MKNQMLNIPRVSVSPKTFASLLDDAREVYVYTEEQVPLPTSEQGSRCFLYKGVIFTELKD
jgi:hypothetical protein